MNSLWERIVASIVCAALFLIASLKSVGALQQVGYKPRAFLRWLRNKENLLYNRLCVLGLCLALATTVVALCFSFLGGYFALLLSALPFLALWIFYAYSERKYALKVPLKYTPRARRLLVVHYALLLCFSYAFIAFLKFLSVWNGSALYALIAFVPFSICPLLLPFLLCLSAWICAPFEKAHSNKFVKRAGQVLDETKIVRIAVVGSYGKTSVKNILKTLLSEKYLVVATPESYNTPMGISKTVLSEEFKNKEIFIAETGARRRGDIAELCNILKPDYAVFTGVCAQHILSFGSEEEVLLAKSEIFESDAFVVCGRGLQGRVPQTEKTAFAVETKNARLGAKSTAFTLVFSDGEIEVETKLLGNNAVENISLAASLAKKLGLTNTEIKNGIEKLQPVPHRLQLLENGGVYILDDAYNANPLGAKEALAALSRFDSRKCVVTPGIVECGVLEESINGELGKRIAESGADKVVLVGQTLVTAVKTGYLTAGGNAENLVCVKTLDEAKSYLSSWLTTGDCVLFLNDLPDAY